jgi:hypothetical protein
VHPFCRVHEDCPTAIRSLTREFLNRTAVHEIDSVVFAAHTRILFPSYFGLTH